MAPSDPTPIPGKESARRASAFASGIGPRLGFALAAAACLWLAVFWALAR